MVTVRANKPWYKSEPSAEKKRLRRKCQRKYKNTRSESDKLLMKAQRNRYNNPLNYTKKDNIKTKIENPQCPKDLYEICDKLLNPEQKSVLPSHDCTASLANTFVEYLKNKIEIVHSYFLWIFEYIYWPVTIHRPNISFIIFWIV